MVGGSPIAKGPRAARLRLAGRRGRACRHEGFERDVERIGDPPEHERGRVALTSLGLAKVGHGDPSGRREVLEREAVGGALLADTPAECA